MAGQDLFAAAIDGDVAGVNNALQSRRFVVDSEDLFGQTALHHACYHGHEKVVKFLLDRGATVDAKIYNKFTPLMCTILQSIDNHIAAKHLLERGASLNLQDASGESALMLAVNHGCFKVVELLLKKGANVNLQDNDGWSALLWGTGPTNEDYDSCEVVQLLLEKGANVDLQANNGMSALMWTCDTNSRWEQGREAGRLKMAKLLLLKHANTDLQTNTGGVSALMLACKAALWDVVDLLLQHGAKDDLVDKLGQSAVSYACIHGRGNHYVNYQDENGMSFLMNAAVSGDLSKALVFLVHGGANPDLVEKNNKRSALILAALNGCIQVASLLVAGADVDIQDREGWSALMIASKNGHEELCTILLEKSANLNLQNGNGVSALMIASGRGHPDVVKLLLEKDADVNLKDTDGWTALTWASGDLAKKSIDNIAFVSLEVVKLLLGRRAIVDHQDNDGMSALMNTCTHMVRWNGKEPERLEMVELLLDSHPNVDLQNKVGMSALMLACKYALWDVVDLLLRYGANDDLVDEFGKSALIYSCMYGKGNRYANYQDEDGMSALMYAAVSGDLTKAEAFLKTGGADPDLVEKNNDRSALILAALYGHIEVAGVLVAEGADVDIQDKEGWSALMITSEKGYEKLFTALLEKSADLNMQNSKGQTSLHLAIINGHGELATKLVHKGADVNIQDSDGTAPLHIAVQDEQLYDLVKLLLDKGARLNIKDNKKRTPLLLCRGVNANLLLDKISAQNINNHTKLIDDQDINGHSKLMDGAKNGQYEIVSRLLKAGARVDLRDNAGMTALSHASSNGNCKIAHKLVKEGAGINIQDDTGKTPLRHAMEGGHSTVTDMLVNEGADIHLRCMDGKSVFSMAKNDPDFSELLEHAMSSRSSRCAEVARAKFKTWLQYSSALSPHPLYKQNTTNGAQMAMDGIFLEVGSLEKIQNLWKVSVCTLPLLLPSDYQAASPVYRIERLQDTADSVAISIHHYAKEAKKLVLLTAPLSPKSGAGEVYDFDKLPESMFGVSRPYQVERIVNQPAHLLVASESGGKFLCSLRLHITHHEKTYIEAIFYICFGHPFYESSSDKIIAGDTQTANRREASLARLGIASNSHEISLQGSEDSWDVKFDREVISKESIYCPDSTNYPPKITITALKKATEAEENQATPPVIAVVGVDQQFSFPLKLKPLVLSLRALTTGFKWRDEVEKNHTFRLRDKVSAKWKDFGMLLGIEFNLLNAWNAQERGNASRCWTRVMDHWLMSNNEDYPATWEGLEVMLSDIGYPAVAEKLKEALSRN